MGPPWGAFCQITLTSCLRQTVRSCRINSTINYYALGVFVCVCQLLDGSTSAQLGRYCGSNIPDPVTTSSNRLRITFRADSSNSGQGFLLHWRAVSPSAVVTVPPANTTNPPGTPLRSPINPLMGTGNYSATSKSVHWPLMGGLLHLVQRGGDWAGPQPAIAPPRCTKCNSPRINGQCTNHRIAV